MKRAKFRLQPVLELRRTEERACAVAAAQAANAASEADRRATEYEATLTRAVVPRSMPAGQFRAVMTLLRTAATDAADARALATASAEQSELVRAKWTAAAQRTKGLERLRDRHLAALQHAEDVAEERAVDDLVTGRYGRATAGRAADAPLDTGEVPWTE
jgi:flagellar export protein FliJ